jgi:flavin-dependent dehydrogenase
MARLFDQQESAYRAKNPSRIELEDGSRVAVIGGGPAGSFFCYFFLDLAERAGRNVEVDMYEPRDFSGLGPIACNMCGGIISESLVQNLAAEGINLPSTVVQRGIDSYVLHEDVGSVRIDTPLHEKRIGAVHRASGPRDLKEKRWRSFDGFLQECAVGKGANLIRERVDAVTWEDDRLRIKTKDGSPETYDLFVVAVGANSTTLKRFQDLPIEYKPPQTTKTFLREYRLGGPVMSECLGSSMHVFLLDIPGLEFAAIIPKGDYASVCLLGDEIDRSLLKNFLNSPEVKGCMPPDWQPDDAGCQCSPRIVVRGATQPFADRIVFIGDAGVTRLYKDGIGAAYRTAKAAATTAIFEGVSSEDFNRHYWPTCRTIERDNGIGKFVFAVTRQIQKRRYARRALYRMVVSEQKKEGKSRDMSMVMWDLFTGSAPYSEILRRMVGVGFLIRLFWNTASSIVSDSPARKESAGRAQRS